MPRTRRRRLGSLARIADLSESGNRGTADALSGQYLEWPFSQLQTTLPKKRRLAITGELKSFVANAVFQKLSEGLRENPNRATSAKQDAVLLGCPIKIYSDRKRPGNHLRSPPTKQEILICPSFALSDQTDSSKSTFLLPSSPPVGASLQAPYILESVGRARSLPFGLESQFGFSERRSRPSKELAKLGPVRPKPLCTTTALPVST